MSLLELLVVLALLGAVVAVSWPALRRPLNRSHVQGAAQQLQRDLLATRRAAMESGNIHWFRYRQNSDNYHCGTNLGDEFSFSQDYDELPDDEDRESTESSTGEFENRGALPDGVRFSVFPSRTDVADYSRSRIDRSGSWRAGDAVSGGSKVPGDSELLEQSPGSGWSRPLRFYPSGRMESGKVLLASEDGYEITVEIQGLGGSIRIHSLRRRDGDGESRSTNEGKLGPRGEEDYETAPMRGE